MTENPPDGPSNTAVQDSNLLLSDLEFTSVDEKPSNYVSALVRYDSFKFEKNVSTTAKDILNESCSDYYSSILNVSSLESARSSGCNCDAVTDLFRARSFDIVENNTEGQLNYEKIPESFEFDTNLSNNCDICFSPLGDLSRSSCKKCKIKSHTSCLLNSCNTVTELAPVSHTDNSESPEGASSKANYEYVCKICLANPDQAKRPKCCICNLSEGVMNYTDKLYYHPFCVYYSYDVLYPYFNNNLILSNPHMFKVLLNSVSYELKGKSEERSCKICRCYTGTTIKCKYPTCNNYLHPRCIMMSYSDHTHSADRIKKTKSGGSSDHKGLLIFMMIKYSSNLGGRNLLFKASFCSEHTSKKYINYSIYKQLVNQSILSPSSVAKYSKYRHLIDDILMQYFVSSNNLKFKIDTNIKIPEIVSTVDNNKKRRKLEDVLTNIKSTLSEPEDDGTRSKDSQSVKEDSPSTITEDIVTLDAPKPASVKANQEKVDDHKKGLKDKKDDEDLKVQKVLWQKFDIFNPITFNPFTTNFNRKDGLSPTAASSGQSNKTTSKSIAASNHETHDDAPLLSVLLYNKDAKDNILPLNSILFDNIKSNHELSLCYQQKILTSCTGVLEYLNSINKILSYREDDDVHIFVLFENVISNYLLVYSINRKTLNGIHSDDLKLQMQHDLKSLLSNNALRESSIKDNPLFSNINVYGMKDDIKYIHSVLSNATSGGSSSTKNKHLAKKLKLTSKIKINNFEMELLKRSILEIRNANYLKLIVVNSLTSLTSSANTTGMCAPSIYSEEKYINYIDWNKVINNIKNLYDTSDASTPLKYDEYRLLTHFNNDFNREKQQPNPNALDMQINYAKTEYKFIEAELSLVNLELIKIKNKLHEKILEYCSENCLDPNKQMKDKNQINKYEFNEYYYYVLYNISKLFSIKNKLNLPDLNVEEVESFKKPIPGGKRLPTEHHVPENLDEESKFCQICYNEEENNINVLIKCSRCLIVVHKYCYNVPISKIIRTTEYLCNRCEHEKKQLSAQYQSNYKKFSILCNICKRGSGPLTRTKDEWYHPFCYLMLILSPNSKVFNQNKKTVPVAERDVNETKNEPQIKEDTVEESPPKENYEEIDEYIEDFDEIEEPFADHQDNQHGLEYQDTVEYEADEEEPAQVSETRCAVCGLKDGVMIECVLCTNRFHPLCAYFHGFKFHLLANTNCLPGSHSSRIEITCNNHFTLSDIDERYSNNNVLANYKKAQSLGSKVLKHTDLNSIKSGDADEPELAESFLDMELITTVMNNRYKRYINRDVNDTVYDKDKKKRIINPTPITFDSLSYDIEPKGHTDNTCNVCFRDNGEICCTNCNKYVHRACYPFQINYSFKCDQCVYNAQLNKDRKGIYCYICYNNDPLLIKLYDNMYYHISCKIIYNCSDYLNPDVFYVPDDDKFQLYSKEDQLLKEQLQAASEEKASPMNKRTEKQSGCNICLGVYGFMVYCYKNNCNLKFHPNCAMKSKLVMEPYYTTEGMRYISLCHEHSLLHNTVGDGLKDLLKFRVQLLMTRNIFKDLYDQNIVLKSILRKRNEIYNLIYPLDKIYNS